nr:D-alanyl-D-alanine carboxypeptidase/D-alanyl-D-alanine-endopeptidase [uncultured Sphingomonas sp.]
MRALLLAALFTATPASAQGPANLQQQVEAKLAEAGPGVRFGLVVATLDGRELLAISPDGRFVPASNTKLFTTAAAYELMPGLDRPDAEGGTLVRFEPGKRGIPDVVLEGYGDPRLSSAADCRTNCLSTLADAIAARTKRVGSVVGDALSLHDERWSFGMSWNNIPTRSGTALAALMIDSNEVALRVSPGKLDEAPRVGASDYLRIDNHARTVGDGVTNLAIERLPGSRTVRLTGTILSSSEEQLLRLGIDDPAHHAAWRLSGMLKARGVRVLGDVRSRYLEASSNLTVDRPAEGVLARATPAPLRDDLTTINKVSQNVHAELLLRRLGASQGEPNVAGGLQAVRVMLDRAGVPTRAATLADGSGMSPYNRVSPRGVVILLRWAAGRPWGAAFRASLPIGGVDGTLRNRFRDGPLKGRVFAKTGSLTAANALSGYMLSARGETLVFSFIANDVPEEVRATAIMDRALELIAASR